MTVIRKGEAPENPEPGDRGTLGPATRIALSEAGGLMQYGAYVVTLHPGSASSERHWHEAEDEFLYMLRGAAVVVEEDGEHAVGPGDAACWPAGVANGHRVVNRSDAPCSFLIVGTRPERDVCHYPDLGRTQYDDGPEWRVVDRNGTVLRQGRRRRSLDMINIAGTIGMRAAVRESTSGEADGAGRGMPAEIDEDQSE